MRPVSGFLAIDPAAYPALAVQTRYLLIASVVVALVILGAGAVYFLVGFNL